MSPKNKSTIGIRICGKIEEEKKRINSFIKKRLHPEGATRK